MKLSQEPKVLSVVLELRCLPKSDEPGTTPDETSLFSEGCADIGRETLLEAWARHTLVWINTWSEDGPRSLHAEWEALAHGIGEDADVGGRKGKALGTDERFGLILNDGSGAALVPLTELLEDPR